MANWKNTLSSIVNILSDVNDRRQQEQLNVATGGKSTNLSATEKSQTSSGTGSKAPSAKPTTSKTGSRAQAAANAYQDEQNALREAQQKKTQELETAKTDSKKYSAEANQSISKAEEKAEEQAPKLTDKNRKEAEQKKETLVSDYNKALTEWRAASASAATADDMEAAEALKAKVDSLGEELDAVDLLLGNGKHLYSTEDKVASGVQGWWNGRIAGDKGFLGNVAQSLLALGDDTAEDETGNALAAEQLREIRAKASEGADALWESAKEQKAKGDEQWQQAVQDESGTVQLAANVARAGADVAADMVENTIVPGAGTVRMYVGAWGSASLEQDEKENNSLADRTLAGAKSMLSAYLSTKLLGGIETYGESVAGDAVKKFTAYLGEKIPAVANPTVQKTLKVLINTEGFEEGLEDVLNYAGDKLLNLDPEAKLEWNDVKTDMFVGYVLGVLTAGLSAGLNYTQSDLHQVADEAADMAQSGKTLDQAMLETAEAAGTATEAPVMRGVASDEDVGSREQGAGTSAQQTVTELLADISNSKAETILKNPDLLQAFSDITGIDLTGMSKSEARKTIKTAAAEQQTAAANAAEARARAQRNAEVDDIIAEFRANEAAEAGVNSEEDVGSREQDVGSREQGVESGQEPIVNSDEDVERRPKTYYEKADEAYQNEAPLRETFNETSNNAPESPQTNVASEPTNNTTETGNANPESLTRENGNPEANERTETAEDTEMTPQQRRAEESWNNADRQEKVSRFWWNTLTKNGLGDPDNPITYIPKSEAESMSNAYNRLQTDFEGEVRGLMTAEAWSGEQTDMAYMIERQLYSEGRTDEMHEWQIEMQKHLAEGGRGIQAVAKQSRPDAFTVSRESTKLIAEARESGKVDAETIDAVQQASDEITAKMLEAEKRRASGDEQGAMEIYLEIADRANDLRNTGFMSDALSEKVKRQAQKLTRKFHKMLVNQDIDYIARFVACQATGVAEDLNYETGAVDIGRKINTLQKLAQLTGTGTWLRNILGNTSFGLIDILSTDNPVTLVMDQAISKATGKRSVGFEKGMAGQGNLKTARMAMERSILEIAANIDLAEDTNNTKYDTARTRTNSSQSKSITERFLSRWEQLNGYMLRSTDEFAKGSARQSYTAAVERANARNGYDVSNAEIGEAAGQVADYRTFQNNGAASEVANTVRDQLNRIGIGGEGDTHKGGFGLGTAVLPYAQVPANIGVKGVEFSPLGAAKGVAEIVSIYADAKAGKDISMARQNKAITDFGRGVTGTMAIAMLAGAMKNTAWFKDWDNEDDDNIRQQNKAEGKSGQEINLSMLQRWVDGDRDASWQNGDKTIDISAIEPLNQLLTAASLMAEGNSLGSSIFTASKDSIMDIPAMQTLQSIENQLRYTDTPEDAWETAKTVAAGTAGSVASGFIPAPVRHLANVTDEYQRDTSGNNAAERAVNQFKASLPIARQTLPVKTDAYGNELKAGSVGTRLANQYLAAKYTEVQQSDVSKEVERIRNETGVDHTPDYSGPKKETFGSGTKKETVELTTAQRRDYKNTQGKAYSDAVGTLMKSGFYKTADSATQSEILSEIESYAKDEAKSGLAKDVGKTFSSDYEEVRALDKPVQYLAEKVRFNLANREERWDDVDSTVSQLQTMSESDREYALSKSNTLKSFWEAFQSGVKAKTVNTYNTGVKQRAAERGSTSANGSDIFAEIAEGNYSKDEADYFMNRQQTDGDYVVAKGRHAVYQAVTDAGYSADVAKQFWDMTQQNDTPGTSAAGTLTKKEVNAYISAFPEPWRSQIKNAIYEACGWS